MCLLPSVKDFALIWANKPSSTSTAGGQRACFYATLLTNMVIYMTFGNLSAQPINFPNAAGYVTQSLTFFHCFFIYVLENMSSNTLHNLDICCWACCFSSCRIYFVCQKSSHRFLLLFSQFLRILLSLKLWNKKYRSACSFHSSWAFISLSSLAWGKSLMFGHVLNHGKEEMLVAF